MPPPGGRTLHDWPKGAFLLTSHRARTLGVLTVAAFAAVGTGVAQAKPTITMSGSTTVFPLASKLARGYLTKFPKSVTFKLAQGGSDIGVADVAAGRVSIGNSSRDPKPTDPGGLVFNKIAKDALCLATNSANKLSNLSQAQIQGIFSGQIKDWSQVPGSTTSGPIDLVVRTAASGTQDAFQKLFMGTAKVSTTAKQYASNGLQQQAVKTDPHAIAYVSLDFTKGLNVPGYAGVACTLRNAKAGQYGGTRNLYMVTRGPATGAVKKFIKWTTGKAGQKIAAKGWVPIR
jgi:phosphate transport system substrate-binding protein